MQVLGREEMEWHVASIPILQRHLETRDTFSAVTLTNGDMVLDPGR